MELINFSVPRSLKTIYIAPLGDIQYTADSQSTAEEHLKRHIDRCMRLGAFFVGTGDYVDCFSPSNRQALKNANLYDTATPLIWDAAMDRVEKLFDKFLAPTAGRWLGLVHGHHFHTFEGRHTDDELAKKLKTRFLGTSAFIRIPQKQKGRKDFVLHVQHGTGGAGKLPGAALNAMYHYEAGMRGADAYIMGHNNKLATSVQGRPYATWGDKERDNDLDDTTVHLVNCGSFSKGTIVRLRSGGFPDSSYPEKWMMTPTPLRAPIIMVELDNPRMWERTWVMT